LEAADEIEQLREKLAQRTPQVTEQPHD
jgi:hypothetical protein